MGQAKIKREIARRKAEAPSVFTAYAIGVREGYEYGCVIRGVSWYPYGVFKRLNDAYERGSELGAWARRVVDGIRGWRRRGAQRRVNT